MCERARCLGGETSRCSSTCLDVCVECPPSAASKPHSRTCHWRFDPGGTNSLWTVPWMSEKNDQHGLDIAANLTRFFFFRPRWIWRLPLQRLLLSLMVITMHPYFITACDIGDEVGVVFWLLVWVPCRQKRDAFWSLLSSLGTNLAEMRLMFKLSTKMSWTVPYDSPTISQTSWIVCLRSARIASRTFAMFSGVVLVDGRPERSSSSTDVRPALKRFYHKKVLLWLMALSPKASCSIRWASATVFFKTNKIWCRFFAP